jgi:glyoxylase-like metal-dependent hydrolase (beta-lactamase superfamily II)
MNITMKREDHIAAKIRALGVRPDNVALVLFTHLHNDHMGDIREFSSSRILIHTREWESALKKGRSHGFRPDYLSSLAPETFELPASAPYGPFDSSLDVLEDGTIIAVPTPGHTAGHVSYFVHTGEESFFLTGDTAWVEENYVLPARKGLLAHMLLEADRKAQKDSLARIHYLYTIQRDLIFISGHDGKVIEDPRLRRFVVQ